MTSQRVTAAAIVGVVIVIILVVSAFTVLAPSSSHTTSSTTSTTTSTSVSTSTSSSRSTSVSTSTSSSTSSQSEGSSITVTSLFSGGGALTGVYTELQQGDALVSTGYTPVTFAVVPGQNYTITVNNFENDYFNHWSDGYTLRVITVEANASSGTLTAVYTTTPQPPPQTAYSITVDSTELNGTAITGQSIAVSVDGNLIASGTTPATFPDLEPGVQYQVLASSAGYYYFREFSDGDLNNYESVAFNSTGSTTPTYTALYQYVPPSQAVYLNIMAELPNGTLLGTTVDSVQVTPGMYLTVTPPGTDIPFTAAYTGSSELPFVLLRNGTYTVTMTIAYGNYKFAYWQDNNNIDPVRAVTLNSNMTLIAIYNYSAS